MYWPKICVSFFCTIFVRKVFHCEKDVVTCARGPPSNDSNLGFRVKCSLLFFSFSQYYNVLTNLVNFPVVTLHEISVTLSRIVTFGRTDTTNIISVFLPLFVVNAPKVYTA
jgi:hypothetical protein